MSFHVIRTWTQGNDPGFEEEKNRVLELYDNPGKDEMHDHIKVARNPTNFSELCRYLRTLHPPEVRTPS